MPTIQRGSRADRYCGTFRLLPKAATCGRKRPFGTVLLRRSRPFFREKLHDRVAILRGVRGCLD